MNEYVTPTIGEIIELNGKRFKCVPNDKKRKCQKRMVSWKREKRGFCKGLKTFMICGNCDLPNYIEWSECKFACYRLPRQVGPRFHFKELYQ